MYTRVFTLYFISLFLCTNKIFSAPLFSKENCIVTTKAEYKNGETKFKTSTFTFKTKAECISMNKTLSDNFDPDRINKVSAKYRWQSQ